MSISNMTIEIADKRTFFWQWDTGCKLRVTGVDESGQVHFYRDGMTEPFLVPIYKLGEDIVCDVPDEILQIPKKFAAYTYDIDEFGGKTYISKTFTVESRPKPANYIYTPTEHYTVEQVVKEAIEDIKDGIPSKSIVDVESLPTEEIDDALLYRTHEGVFYFDGVWHKVADESDIASVETELQKVEEIAKGAEQAKSYGDIFTMISTLNDLPNTTFKPNDNINIIAIDVPDFWIVSVEEDSVPYAYKDDTALVDEIMANGTIRVGYYVLARRETGKVVLTDYVQKTDYATSEKAGLIRPGNKSMLMVGDKLIIVGADKKMIDSKGTAEYFLTPSMLDYIIKYGITTNAETWTEDTVDENGEVVKGDKTKARELFGAVGFNDTVTKDGDNFGLVRLKPWGQGGFTLDPYGRLALQNASTAVILGRASTHAITPAELDRAVKFAITGYKSRWTGKETVYEYENLLNLTDEEKGYAHKWLGIPTVLDEFDLENAIESWACVVNDYTNGGMTLVSEIPYPPEALIGATLKFWDSANSPETTTITESMVIHKDENGYTIRKGCAYMFVAYNNQYVPSIPNSNCYPPKAGVYFTSYDNGDPCQVNAIIGAKRIIVDNDALDLENNAVIKALMARIEALENK